MQHKHDQNVNTFFPKVQHNHAYAKKQRGQLGGIISAVLALAVAAIGLAYVMGAFNGAKGTTNAQGATTDFISMISKTQTTFNNSTAGYAGITVQSMGQNGDIPSSMWNSATPTVMTSPFGTPVTVASNTITTAGDSANLTLTVPQANCADFANALATNVEALTIGGTPIVDNNAGTALDAATLGTACNGAAGAKQFVLTITR